MTSRLIIIYDHDRPYAPRIARRCMHGLRRNSIKRLRLAYVETYYPAVRLGRSVSTYSTRTNSASRLAAAIFPAGAQRRVDHW
jgi:hypothetical protein